MSRGQKEMATSATANSLPTLLVKTAATATGQDSSILYGALYGNDAVDNLASHKNCFRSL